MKLSGYWTFTKTLINISEATRLIYAKIIPVAQKFKAVKYYSNDSIHTYSTNTSMRN